jgi:hypothetical protein
MQSIQNINVKVEHGEAVVELTVSKGELMANWQCAASLAEKEGMSGTASRLRADVAVMERLKAGDRILIVGGE